MTRKLFRFIMLIGVPLIVQATNSDDSCCTNNEDNISKMICCLFVGILFSLVLFNIAKNFNLPFPFRVVVISFGAIFGVIAKFHPSFDTEIENSILMKPKLIFMMTVPILVFRIAFNLDIHTFIRSWLQIFVLAGPGFILSSCFTGLMMMLLMPDFTFTMSLLFGCICTAIYPIEIVHLLEEVGQFKPLTVLLEGESIIGDATVVILFTLTIGVMKGVLPTWYHVSFVFLRFSIGGVLLGYVCGSILVFLMRTIHNDVITMTMLPLCMCIITYFVATEILYVSGIIAVVVLGLKTGMEKASMSTDNESFLTYFWDLLAHCADTAVCFLTGVLIVKLFSLHNMFRDNAIVLVTYIVTTAGRLFSYILVTPVVSRLGYGLTFKEMVIAVWSGLKGPFPVLLGLTANHASVMIGREILFHISGLMVLTLLINASSMPYVLKILGVSEVSVIRKINMNNCIRHLHIRRERTIATLKMDRFLSDANWSIVNDTTKIKHPYKINYSDSDDEPDTLFYNRRIVCPDCNKEISYDPTNKEMAAMLREARLRILKAKKISYTRQYESGMLSKDGIRILLQAIEVAMDTPDALIELDGLRRYFKRQGFLHYARRKLLVQFFKKRDCPVKPPRRYWRKICYKIVTNTIYELLLHVCIIIHTVSTCLELFLCQEPFGQLSIAIIVLNIFFFLVFFLEFVMKILAFSWIYICVDGFKAYFTSYWNIFDFICLGVLFVDVIFITLNIVQPGFSRYHKHYYTAILIAKLCRIIRLIRILTLFKGLYPKLILYCDSKIDEHSAFAYDIGKGVVTGEEEVTSVLQLIIDNAVIREMCRVRIEADRLVITKELGIIQKDKPWIAITVKTRQAARSTLNSMQDAVQELKLSGGADDFEYMKLMESFENSFKDIRSKLRSVQPSSPKEMFKEVPWMTGDEEICNFLYSNVVTKVFDQGEVICVDGELSDNIYILVTGIFKLTYIPKTYILDRLYDFGALPVMDYIKSPRFQERLQDYILSGNCVGELSVLTNRPYDCSIVAESASQVYVISKDVIQSAFTKKSNIVNGLEARIWKAISIRLVTTILVETPAYQSSTLEQIKYSLERAFVPKLTNYKLFCVNDLVEDVILLEGVIWDWNTKSRFTAPCYIPRTVQKVMFPASMNFVTNIESKLLIIPAKDNVDFKIIQKLEDMSEMVSIASSRCLQHTVQNKMARKKRKLGPQEYYRRSKVSVTKSGDTQSITLSKSKESPTENIQHTYLRLPGEGLRGHTTRNKMNSSGVKDSFELLDFAGTSGEYKKSKNSKDRSKQYDRTFRKSLIIHQSGSYMNPEKDYASVLIPVPNQTMEIINDNDIANRPKMEHGDYPKGHRSSSPKRNILTSKKSLKRPKTFFIKGTSSYSDSEQEVAAIDLTNTEKPKSSKAEHN